jgi:hypothetical protein
MCRSSSSCSRRSVLVVAGRPVLTLTSRRLPTSSWSPRTTQFLTNGLYRCGWSKLRTSSHTCDAIDGISFKLGVAIDLTPAIHPTSREHIDRGRNTQQGMRNWTKNSRSERNSSPDVRQNNPKFPSTSTLLGRGRPIQPLNHHPPPGPAGRRQGPGRGGERAMGTYEVDGRLDVLDEGGSTLVLGRRVAVQAAHVLRLSSGVGHDVLRPRRAAADETHHLELAPPPQPRLRSAVASRRRPLSSSSPVYLLACLLPWTDEDEERNRGRERVGFWPGVNFLIDFVCLLLFLVSCTPRPRPSRRVQKSAG